MVKFLILALSLISTHVSAQSTKLSKLDTTQYFDFWEGTWEGTWPEGDKQGKAINKVFWISGDKVLHENFEVIEGQSKGFKGTSISVYRPQLDIWKQAWADNQGGYFDFVGSFESNNRMFQTQPVERNGQMFIQRMVFREIKEDSFTWDWEASQDGGKTWNLNWQIKYTRLD